MRVTAKNDTGQIGAIDGHGNGFAKLRGAEPGFFVFSNRCSGDLIEPYEFGIEARAGIMSYRRRFFLQTAEVFGIQYVDQVNLTTAEAQQLDITISLNIEANGIKIWKRLSILVFFPVIRVSPQEDGGTGRVVRGVKWAENGHLLLRRMRGENRDLIEEAFESRHRGRESNDHSVR